MSPGWHSLIREVVSALSFSLVSDGVVLAEPLLLIFPASSLRAVDPMFLAAPCVDRRAWGWSFGENACDAYAADRSFPVWNCPT